MTSINYSEKKKREKEWHEQSSLNKEKSLISTILHSKIFFSPERRKFEFNLMKNQMKLFVQQHLQNKKVDKLLIAPCGNGVDYEYLKEFANLIYGIDLSPIPLKECPTLMQVKEGDILKSEYPNEFFEFITSPLFFHHILSFGFEHFLNEFYRILKPGGYLVILEPSIFYPLNAFTRPLKKITGNIYGEVEDEAPFNPRILINSLKKTGFVNLDVKAASFGHMSLYIPIAKAINFLTKPLLKTDKFWKYFASVLLFWGEKPLLK